MWKMKNPRDKTMRRDSLMSLRLLHGIVIPFLLLLFTIDVSGARGFKRNYKQGQGDQYGTSRSLRTVGLFPSAFNVATKAEIFANATCGEDGPETFCKPSESSRCAVCDSRSPDPGKRHNISHVLNPDPGKWWQSPTLAQGDRYEYVTIILDLKQIYQIENVIVKAANSPRPAAWILERSLDGENFRPWQYYAPSDEECWSRYSIQPMTGKPISIGDDEILCTSIYSRQTPMENGEIHTHLLNGRVGAANHTSSLQEFTQARYVKLRLQGLRRNGGVIADKRRAFYSIKEISIGGRCLCSGHASRCRYSPRHGHQECECERHTCGERCDKCCPMYNQIPWKPGTSMKGFHCEKCNCHGHANSCHYDDDIAERKLSLDTRGKYRGGGVCINCTEHTTGINCERCEIGYYRPNGVPPDAPEPCLPCDHCNLRGSTGYCTPDDSYTNVGKVTGACECKPGYSGYKCDQCAAGYRQFPDCMRCPCDSRGILPSHDCEGDCLCKMHVDGEYCDRCKIGYYGLTRDNLEGCLQCDCFGITNKCRAAILSYESISNLEGWMITDMNASRSVLVNVDEDSGLLTMSSFEVEYQSPYWLAPKIYAGNRLSSYGSNLTYSVSWVVMRGDTSGNPTIEPNVILVGKNGMRIAYGEEQYNGQGAEISVSLQEQGWYHVRSEVRDIATRLRRTEFRGDAVTRSQMLQILSDIEHIMIRAQYHSEQIEGSLLSAILPIGEKTTEETGETLVEQCECPEGYVGFSCENCAWGYAKIIINGTDHQNHHECVKCDCHGHAGSCDLVMGECKTCEHHTTGPKCDRCSLGYYGDPRRATSGDCKRCACPLIDDLNNFSPSCQLDDPDDIESGYVCTQCPLGYMGDHCESCDYGYFGNPSKPGGKCEPCSCNGGSCDPETGQCLECRGNTEGWRCDRCKENHYGNPLEQNCLPCNCNDKGSNSSLCDSISGQCNCLPFFGSRDCSSCIEGYGNVDAGCKPCDCDIGAMNKVCDGITGNCVCAFGVAGHRCDQCELHHYGLSVNGCSVINFRRTIDPKGHYFAFSTELYHFYYLFDFSTKQTKISSLKISRAIYLSEMNSALATNFDFDGLSDLETLELFHDNCQDPGRFVDSDSESFEIYLRQTDELDRQLHEHRSENDSLIDFEDCNFFADNYLYLNNSSSLEKEDATNLSPSEQTKENSNDADTNLSKSNENSSESNNENRPEKNLDKELFLLDMSDFALLRINSDEATEVKDITIGDWLDEIPELSETNEKTYLCGEGKINDETDEVFLRPKTYDCRYCLNNYYNKMSLRQHEFWHAKKLLKCTHCKHRSRSRGALIRHFEYYHCHTPKRRTTYIWYDSL